MGENWSIFGGELEELIGFSNRLDRHCQEERVFFSPALLDLLAECTGCWVSQVTWQSGEVEIESTDRRCGVVLKRLLGGREAEQLRREGLCLCEGGLTLYRLGGNDITCITMAEGRWFFQMRFPVCLLVMGQMEAGRCFDSRQIERLKHMYRLMRSRWAAFEGRCADRERTDREDKMRETAARYRLTKRELEVVEKFRRGMTYQEIADALYINISTVRTHVKSIYRKSGVNNQRELLMLYSGEGSELARQRPGRRGRGALRQP